MSSVVLEEPDIRTGDCIDVLKKVPDGSVNLIVTSPPYGAQRKDTYGGIPPDQYVDWFLPRAVEFKRTLAADGSFILNIKEHADSGQRHLYVHKLVIALVEQQGWRLVDEFIWHKKNSSPGKWPNRFRDAWEHIFHFTKNPGFKFRQDQVKIQAAASTLNRAKHLGVRDFEMTAPETGSGLKRCVANCVGRELVYPSNVLHLSAETGNQGHSAAYPVALPEFFVKLMSAPGDLVMDPFAGSGTTGVVCRMHGRRFLGIDIHKENCDLCRKRWEQTPPSENDEEAAGQ